MSSVLEDRVADTLRRHAASLDAAVTSHQSLDAVRRRGRRRRAQRRVAGLSATVVLLLGSFGLLQQVNQPSERTTLVSEVGATPLRLLPDYLPVGADLVRRGEYKMPASLSQQITVWGRAGSDPVFVQVVGLPVGAVGSEVETRSLETALASLGPSEGLTGGTPLSWTVEPQWSVFLTVPTARKGDLAAIARSIRVDAVTGAASADLERFDLPLRFSGDASALVPTQRWTLVVRLATGLLTIDAQLENEFAASLGLQSQKVDPNTKVRGVPARQSVSPAGADLTWEEQGWVLSASGPDAGELRKVVESLKPVDEQTWAAVNTLGVQPTVPRSPDPTEQGMTFESAGGITVVKLQLKVTERGCLQLSVSYHGAASSDFCVPVSELKNEPVRWITTTVVEGRAYVVGLVSEAVDAVSVGQSAQRGEAELGSSLDAMWTDGAVVQFASGEYRWVGVAVVDADPQAKTLALYEAVRDDDAPDAEVDLGEAEPDVYDFPLRRIGLVKIPEP